MFLYPNVIYLRSVVVAVLETVPSEVVITVDETEVGPVNDVVDDAIKMTQENNLMQLSYSI